MIDLDLVITVEEVDVILEDLENEKLLTEGQAESILRGISNGATKLGVLIEILLNQCGINLLALYSEADDMDVANLAP